MMAESKGGREVIANGQPHGHRVTPDSVLKQMVSVHRKAVRRCDADKVEGRALRPRCGDAAVNGVQEGTSGLVSPSDRGGVSPAMPPSAVHFAALPDLRGQHVAREVGHAGLFDGAGPADVIAGLGRWV